jgi:hypothetical protein
MNAVAVVDGANVAYIERNENGAPKVSNLTKVRSALIKMGYKVVIIVDASLRHQVDDHEKLESLLDQQIARQAPADTDADYFITELARKMDALIISNDEFAQYREKYPWLEERRVPLMIINGLVELYEPILDNLKSEKQVK